MNFIAEATRDIVIPSERRRSLTSRLCDHCVGYAAMISQETTSVGTQLQPDTAIHPGPPQGPNKRASDVVSLRRYEIAAPIQLSSLPLIRMMCRLRRALADSPTPVFRHIFNRLPMINNG